MKILYIGDIMGKPGRKTVKEVLPKLIADRGIDFVVAQGENLSSGKGMQVKAVEDMLSAGVDFFTGGNWTLHREEILPWLSDPKKPVVRPANYPAGTPGLGAKVISTPEGKILIVSLLGAIVPEPLPLDNPLLVIDKILEDHKNDKLIATIVNFHGDYSSEKRVIGYYLDGRVSLVVGDHWHVPTADAAVLPKGTAHITDVGMVGARDSSLGVKLGSIVPRWRGDHQTRNEIEADGTMQFCSIIVDIDTSSGLAKSIEQVIIQLPQA